MTTALDKGPCFVAHLVEVVKASCPKSSVVKRPSPERVWAVPMTMARILKSRMTVTCHVRFGSSGGVSDGPADCNLAGIGEHIAMRLICNIFY